MRSRRQSSFPLGTFRIAEKHFRPVFCHSGRLCYPKAAAAFYRIAMLMFPKLDQKQYSPKAEVSAPGQTLPNFGIFYPVGIFHTYHTGTKEQREAMNELFIEVQAAIESAHQDGIERGKSLLIMLAKGEITNKQLNDSAVQKEEEG